MRAVINATDRRDMLALVEVRPLLESTAAVVEVTFDDGSRPVTFTRNDLPAIRQKIIFSM